jgi:hypothetical protein
MGFDPHEPYCELQAGAPPAPVLVVIKAQPATSRNRLPHTIHNAVDCFLLS